MLAYRSDDREVETVPVFERLVERLRSLKNPEHDEVLSSFIDLGEFEAGIVDSQFPHTDSLNSLATAFRAAALQMGHGLIASWRGESQERDRRIECTWQRLVAVDPRQLPHRISMRVSEGYAYYALRPETYVVAAERWVQDAQPRAAVCIGIRSIGCSLSAVVAAAAERARVRVTTCTVRPRGHPFDRRIAMDDRLAAVFRCADADTFFLVVDEGPGLSGSSFASVVRALRELGVPADRIILFPSSNPDGSAFRSTYAQTVWHEHRRYWASAEEARCSVQDATGEPNAIDISGGAWRHVFWPHVDTRPAVQPLHEVIKQWLPHSQTVVRFAGLGRYGEGKLRRARALSDAGLGVPPIRLHSGYLHLPFVRAMSWGKASDALISAVARHCAFVTRSLPSQRSPSIDILFDLVVTNIREGCGDVAVRSLEEYRSVLDAAPTAAIDGRMLPHEWLRVDGHFVKVDALDHSQDHFFPGTQDAGWDLSAVAFEFDLDESGRERLLQTYAHLSGDAEINRRMPFYDIAYPAFRLGYATIAAESLGTTADGERFRAISAQCKLRVAQVLASQHA